MAKFPENQPDSKKDIPFLTKLLRTEAKNKKIPSTDVLTIILTKLRNLFG